MVGSQATSQNCDLNDSNGRGWRRTTDSREIRGGWYKEGASAKNLRDESSKRSWERERNK